MNLDQLREPVLSLFRIVTGLMFLLHGVASLFGVFGGDHSTGAAVEFGAWPGWWAALIHLVCGVLVLLGLFTRPSATLASGSMAYAYFVVHQPQALLPMHNGGELAAMYSWAFLLIAVLGSGAWALDPVVRRLREDRTPAPAPSRPG